MQTETAVRTIIKWWSMCLELSDFTGPPWERSLSEAMETLKDIKRACTYLVVEADYPDASSAEAKEAAKMRNARPRKSNAGTGPFGEDGHRRKPRKGPYWWFYLEEDKNLCYCDSCDDGRYRYW